MRKTKADDAAYQRAYYASRPDIRARKARVAAGWRMKAGSLYFTDKSRMRRGLPVPTRPAPLVCECCGRPCTGRLALDHCHLTDLFRGWLCRRCNIGLGHLDDTIAGVKMALQYLQRAYRVQVDS